MRLALVAFHLVLVAAMFQPVVAFAQGEPAAIPAAPTPPSPDRSAGVAEIEAMIAELKALFAAGKAQEAEAVARRTVTRAAELLGPKDGFVGVTSANLGRLLMNSGRAGEAAPLMLKALEIISIYFNIDDQRYKNAVAEFVEASIAAKDPDTALRLYDRIITATAANPKLAVHEAHYRTQLASMSRRLGKLPAAEAELRKALVLYVEHLPADHIDIARVLTDLAGLMRLTGRFAEAEVVYRRVLDTRRKAGDTASVNVGILLDNLGVVYNELGRFAEAEQVQRRALGIFESTLGHEHLTTAQGAANLAALYYQQGRGGEALALFERARGIYTRRLKPQDPRVGVLLDNLGGLYRDLGRVQEARATMREALASLRAAYPSTHPDVAIALGNLAGVEGDLGNDKVAEGLYQQAFTAYAASIGPQSHQMGIALGRLADIHRRQGRLAEAQDGYRRSIAIVEQSLGAEHNSLVRPLRLLATEAVNAKTFVEALALSRRAVKIELANKQRRRLKQVEGRPDRDNEEAFFDALDIAWLANAAGVPGETALQAEAFQAAQWVTLSAAGQSLAQLGVRLSASNPALGALVRERQDLTRDWSGIESKLVKSVGLPAARRDASAEEKLRAQLAANEARTAEIDARFASEFPAFAALGQPRPLPLAETQALLKPDEALLQFVVARQYTHVWAITRENVVWRRLDITGTEIAKRVETLRCGLDSAGWLGEAGLKCLQRIGRAPEGSELPFDGAVAHALYRDLLAPVAGEVRGRSLLIVATGALTSLPFQVLLTQPAPTETTGDMAAAPWLLKSHAVAILPAVTSLAVLRRQAGASRAKRPYLGIANPLLLGPTGDDVSAGARLACPAPRPASTVVATLSRPMAVLKSLVRGGKMDVNLVRGLTPLPETTDEVCAVARGVGANLGRDLLIGPAATKPRVKTASADNSLANYRVVHFATHGLVSGEIAGLAEPALVLTPPAIATDDDDGLLTASDVAALRLDAEVVVLSACNTAAGEGQDGEALSGLARAFFFAGARALVVSHWPVDSDAAVRLITGTFEAASRTPGHGRAKALQQAMLKTMSDRDRPGYAHPRIWAPFVLVGETGASGRFSAGAASAGGPATLGQVSPGRSRGGNLKQGEQPKPEQTPALDFQSVFGTDR